MHPPFSRFLPEENEKTGRARSKRVKEVRGNDAGARLNDRRSRNDFPRAIQFSGGLSVDESTSYSFRWRYPGKRIGPAKQARPILLLGQRQRKEKYAKSMTTSPRCTAPRGSHSGSADHSGAPPYRSPPLLLLLWPVHGPFSRVLREEKEKMGGQRTSHLHG